MKKIASTIVAALATAITLTAKGLHAMLRNLFSVINLIMLAWLVCSYFYFPPGILVLIALCGGAILSSFLMALLKKDTWLFDPDNPGKFAMFVKMDKGRSGMITQGGQPIMVVHGGKIPSFTFTALGIWWLCKMAVYVLTRLYLYLPYLTLPYSQDLPRRRIVEKEGKEVYEVVEKGTKGYRTSHVRTEPTSWPFEYGGVDVEGIPFKVAGSAQYYIDETEVMDALYKTDSYNVLFDQTLNTATRSKMRSIATIDSILGAVPEKIWDNSRAPEDLGTKLSDLVEKYIAEIEIKPGLKLKDVGLHVTKVMYTDFSPEVSEQELAKLRAGAVGRAAGRAADLEGQGVAKAQKALRDVHAAGDPTDMAIIQAEALVRAAKNGDGLLAPLMGILAGNLQQKRDK